MANFGYSIGDAVQLGQLAWRTVDNAGKAYGERDESTHEVSGLCTALKRLENQTEMTESRLRRPDDTCREELEINVEGCKRILNKLAEILEKYNALSEKERSDRKLWQRMKFGNGKMGSLADLRSKITDILLVIYVTLAKHGMSRPVGNIEKQVNDSSADLKELKIPVNGITAQLTSQAKCEGSLFTHVRRTMNRFGASFVEGYARRVSRAPT